MAVSKGDKKLERQIECHNCEEFLHAIKGHCKTEISPTNSNLEQKIRNRDNPRHFARRGVLA
jgi:hypothetical protein